MNQITRSARRRRRAEPPSTISRHREHVRRAARIVDDLAKRPAAVLDPAPALLRP
ncbi:hypothetical protein [Kolteria novifilia]|uniref:hypothetical protein n=1 Tax=Kolteria novifilia TaxID=2527975 RepID=UPI003AF37B7B